MSVLGAAAPAQSGLSALGRRLAIAAGRRDETWLILAENVPAWPAGRAPAPAGEPLVAHAYPPSKGCAELLDAVCDWENARVGTRTITTENVMITNGGMHALSLLIRELADRGFGRAVALTPMFHSVHALLVGAGLKVAEVPIGPGGQVDTSALADASAPRGSVVYLNLPHNPTGAVLTPEVDRLVRHLATRDDLFILFDAVYDSFVFDSSARPTPVDLATAQPHVAVVNSMSKNFGRPGDRIGWIIAQASVIGRLVCRLEHEVVGVSPMGQGAAAAAVRVGNAPLLGAVEVGRDVCGSHWLANCPYDGVALPAGGTQIWLDLGVNDIEAFADFAVDVHHLVLTTSCNYFPSHPGRIRYPTGLPAVTLRNGLRVLDIALAQWADGSPAGRSAHDAAELDVAPQETPE